MLLYARCLSMKAKGVGVLWELFAPAAEQAPNAAAVVFAKGAFQWGAHKGCTSYGTASTHCLLTAATCHVPAKVSQFHLQHSNDWRVGCSPNRVLLSFPQPSCRAGGSPIPPMLSTQMPIFHRVMEWFGLAEAVGSLAE